jgi:membrane-bound lytic murein transglycosylase D
VNKAIRRSGGKRTYWEIRPFLPLETQGYVPAFIAVNYVMNYTAEHNLYPIAPKTIYFHTDTVLTSQFVTFNQISTVLDMPIEDISYLNPQYKLKIIPNQTDKMTLCLPASKVGAFINNENIIYAYKTPQERLDSSLASDNRILVEEQKYHKVKRGETLKHIAKLYSCNISDIKNWNNLKSNKVPSGKRLLVYVKKYKAQPSEVAAISDSTQLNTRQANVIGKEAADDTLNADKAATAKSVSTDSKAKTKFIYYTVQRGDTLWNIANRKGVSVDAIKRLNNIRSSNSLKAGSKIKIAVAG